MQVSPCAHGDDVFTSPPDSTWNRTTGKGCQATGRREQQHSQCSTKYLRRRAPSRAFLSEPSHPVAMSSYCIDEAMGTLSCLRVQLYGIPPAPSSPAI